MPARRRDLLAHAREAHLALGDDRLLRVDVLAPLGGAAPRRAPASTSASRERARALVERRARPRPARARLRRACRRCSASSALDRCRAGFPGVPSCSSARRVLLGGDERELALVRLAAARVERGPSSVMRSRSAWCVASSAVDLAHLSRHSSRAARASRASARSSSAATASPEPPLTRPSGWTTVPSSATSVRPPARGESSSAALASSTRHRVADERATSASSSGAKGRRSSSGPITPRPSSDGSRLRPPRGAASAE